MMKLSHLFTITLLFGVFFSNPFSTLATADIPSAYEGEGEDAIRCGTPEWTPFKSAFSSYCSQKIKKSSSKIKICKKLLRAFSSCEILDRNVPNIPMPPLSKKQISQLPMFEYRIYGFGYGWVVNFSLKNNQWHVDKIDSFLFE